MAESIGRLGSLYVETSPGGGTYAKLEGITDLSDNMVAETIDSTDFDSAGNKESEYGDRQTQISVTVNLNEAATIQALVLTAFLAGTKPSVRYRPIDGSGSQFTFAAKINNFNITNSQGQMVTAQIDLESSGAVTKSTQ